MNADAFRSMGWEFLPAVAVAVPVDGRVNEPRRLVLPATSRAAAGVVVLIPILAVGDDPVWNTAELPTVDAVRKSDKNPGVPEPVMVAAVTARSESFVAVLVGAPMAVGPANTKADAGSPLIVSASCAFMA